MVNITYNIDCKKDILTEYPKLRYIFNGIEYDCNVTQDAFTRYIIYMYSRKSELHQSTLPFTQKKKNALVKFKIPVTKADDIAFGKLELAVATNFLRLDCDAKMELWISLKHRYSHACMKMRDVSNEDTWKEMETSLNSVDKLSEMAKIIEVLERELFGDIEGIRQYLIENNADGNVGEAERYAR